MLWYVINHHCIKYAENLLPVSHSHSHSHSQLYTTFPLLDSIIFWGVRFSLESGKMYHTFLNADSCELEDGGRKTLIKSFVIS